MKKILLLSSIYPIPGSGNKGTEVCHFFTRDWVRMGYDVRVVHFQAVYPRILYLAAKMFERQIAARTGAVVYTQRDKGASYQMDGVGIVRIPVFKPIPHGKFSPLSIRKAIRQIRTTLQAEGFVPDVIVGHFPNPQLEVVSKLSKVYPDATTSIVMHGDTEIMKSVYAGRLEQLMASIDRWGFRCRANKEEFERDVCKIDDSFICYSGIPEEYITPVNRHKFEAPLRKFIYVGEMIERKYPMEVLDALQMAFPGADYSMTYVGNGQLLDDLRKRVAAEGLADRVQILGKIPRNEIRERYDEADCMIMISRGEAYGLVYLEAMARGCITIASRNEGFDGIIVDGENGFLCKAGDAEELARILRRIEALPQSEKLRISENAIRTATSLTDQKAAELYLNDLLRDRK